MSRENPLAVYNVGKAKILLDGDRVTCAGSGDKVFEEVDGGIVLHLIYAAPVLKHFNPKKFKAIICDDNATMVTKMKIEKFKMLPFAIGRDIPTVDVMLYGEPHTTFTD